MKRNGTFKCIYVPEYGRNQINKKYRITKDEIYKGKDKGNGFILIKNDYGEMKSYCKNFFKEVV